MTQPHDLRHIAALDAHAPIALSAWLASVDVILNRPYMADDATDIAILAVYATAALAAIALALLTPRRGAILLVLPICAVIYGVIAGPSLLWKLQAPLAVAVQLARIAHRHLYDQPVSDDRVPTNRLQSPQLRLPSKQNQ